MKTHNKPRLYADFNKWGGDENLRWLILTCKGTFDDLTRLNLQLAEGLEATFYTDDADAAGNSNELEADGYVHFNNNTNEWVGIIDWNADPARIGSAKREAIGRGRPLKVPIKTKVPSAGFHSCCRFFFGQPSAFAQFPPFVFGLFLSLLFSVTHLV